MTVGAGDGAIPPRAGTGADRARDLVGLMPGLTLAKLKPLISVSTVLIPPLIGKAYLVSRLQALFQTSRIQLPKQHAEAAAMTRELMDYEIRISEDANDRYGAFRTGTHDDLVTALGLAVITDPEPMFTSPVGF